MILSTGRIRRPAADAADQMANESPLIVPVRAMMTTMAPHLAAPLSLEVGKMIRLTGSLTSTAAIGRNSTLALLPAVFGWTSNAGTGAFLGIGQLEHVTAAGGVPSTNKPALVPLFVDTGVAGHTGIPLPVPDVRTGAVYRHIGIGFTSEAASAAACPAGTGGGYNWDCKWPAPSWLRGAAKWTSATDDVEVLFPQDMSAPKLAMIFGGNATETGAAWSTNIGFTGQSAYQLGSEPIIVELLKAGYIVACSRGGLTTTPCGNEASWVATQVLVAKLKNAFTFVPGSGFILATSMGGLRGLRLLANDAYFTRFYGFDPVCSPVAQCAPTVTSGNTNQWMSNLSSFILPAHGVASAAAILPSTNPLTWAASVWAGKKMRATVTGGATTNLALGCDGTVARLTNWDALVAIATGATTTTDVGTNTGGVGSDHGRHGNFLWANISALLAS